MSSVSTERLEFEASLRLHAGEFTLYFNSFSQINESIRMVESANRLEWLQSHVNLEGLGEVWSVNHFVLARSFSLFFTVIAFTSGLQC